MNKILAGVLAAVLVIFGIWALFSWQKVPAGHVGVHVYLLGGDKGVDSVARPVGRHFIGWQQELYLYPTFTQNYVWTKGNDPGSEGDESLSFQDKQGLEINADVGIAYNVDPNKATLLFQKYRKGTDEITDSVLRNYVRDALNTETSTMSVEEIYGIGKAGLMERATKRVKDQVEPFGIRIEKIYWINSMRLPAGVQKALNAKIEATQKAQQSINELERTKAEAEKTLVAAQAQRDANALIEQSLTDKVIRVRELEIQAAAVQKWNGQLPTTNATGAIPFINVK